ncbi:MAG: NhaP-type Na+/H+ and K+/H+ antiporter [Clostridium sp.]|jgi:NhaP-type Na+/H+ and K+/H+ antiporter
MLEVESGSNDPFAYMLTITILSIMSGRGEQSTLQLLTFQIFFGVLTGVILAKVSAWILKNITFEIEGLYPVFVMAIAILTYSMSSWLGGNGYLSVYIAGVMIGNSKIQNKKSLVRFLDGISWLMQIMLFFILGLLSFPSHLQVILVPGIIISKFNDYQEESNTKLVELEISPGNKWVNKTIMDANIPDEILVVMIKRAENVIHPKGATMIKSGDVLVLSGDNFDDMII